MSREMKVEENSRSNESIEGMECILIRMSRLQLGNCLSHFLETIHNEAQIRNLTSKLICGSILSLLLHVL